MTPSVAGENQIKGFSLYHGRGFTWTLHVGKSISDDVLVFDMRDAFQFIDEVKGRGNPEHAYRASSIHPHHEAYHNYFRDLWAAVFAGVNGDDVAYLTQLFAMRLGELGIPTWLANPTVQLMAIHQWFYDAFQRSEGWLMPLQVNPMSALRWHSRINGFKPYCFGVHTDERDGELNWFHIDSAVILSLN